MAEAWVRNTERDSKRVKVDALPGRMVLQPYLRAGVPSLRSTNCRCAGQRGVPTYLLESGLNLGSFSLSRPCFCPKRVPSSPVFCQLPFPSEKGSLGHEDNESGTYVQSSSPHAAVSPRMIMGLFMSRVQVHVLLFSSRVAVGNLFHFSEPQLPSL